MAMGDLNAVAYGQAAHLGVLLQSGAITFSDIVSLKGRPRREDWVAGLMIDDFVLLDICDPKEPCEQTKGEQVVGLGQASVALLELISGSLVSIFQLRRRFMSALQEVYGAQRGRRQEDVVQLSPELKDELLSCVVLVVLTQIDLRMEPSDLLIASDASNGAEAAVCTSLGSFATSHLQKHALQKGLWSRLLKPSAAYLKEKGLLPCEEELPEDEEYVCHPLWQTIAESCHFRQFGRVKRVKRRRRINIGEMRAALSAEKKHGVTRPDTYYVHLQDSQVSLAALVKGRSASRTLNNELRRSIPDHITYNTRPFYGFLKSEKNPADDPTRCKSVRKPEKPKPPWLASLLEGQGKEEFEAFLKEKQLGLEHLSELPEEARGVFGHREEDEKRILEKERRAGNKNCEKETLAEEDPKREWSEEAVEAARSTAEVQAFSQHKQTPARFLASSSFFIPPKKQQADGVFCHHQKNLLTPKEGRSNGASAKEVRPPKADAALCSLRSDEKLIQFAEEQLTILQGFKRSQFIFNKQFSSLEDAWHRGYGVLDLFSGSRGVAKALAAMGPVWVLTFDTAHSATEDLVQQQLVRLVRARVFSAMGGGPVCRSFSTAITPPCRTRAFPQGVPWASELQQEKNRTGNEQLRFVLHLVSIFISLGLFFWIENPDSSWFWRQQNELSWDSVMALPGVGDLRLDYCRLGTKWRKRTRFRTNTHLAGQRCFCRCTAPHVKLRGRCKLRRVNMTRLAEPYPRALNHMLAAAVLIDMGALPGRRKVDVAACAKCNSLRIGEAAHPGPRRNYDRASRPGLDEIQLLEPATVKLRSQVWQRFKDWVETNFDELFFSKVLLHPVLLVQVLVAFGYAQFDAGMALHLYRQLLAHVQKEFLGLRPFMGPAWETVTKWELAEPPFHCR
eukprot:Skav207212  [mRNA]  locus=scaffold1244:113945:117027:+ [translate_table: standard]